MIETGRVSIKNHDPQIGYGGQNQRHQESYPEFLNQNFQGILDGYFFDRQGSYNQSGWLAASISTSSCQHRHERSKNSYLKQNAFIALDDETRDKTHYGQDQDPWSPALEMLPGGEFGVNSNLVWTTNGH